MLYVSLCMTMCKCSYETNYELLLDAFRRMLKVDGDPKSRLGEPIIHAGAGHPRRMGLGNVRI